MKKTITTVLVLVVLMLGICFTTAHGQSPASQTSYKDMVGENPNAEADIKVASDFVNALISGDVDKAKSLMASGYKGYGPGPADSTNPEQTISSWKQNYTMQTNRKVSFVPETFNVKSGDLKGHWVSLWGDYSFTQNGKDVKFPFQYTAHVVNGKIDGDRIYYDQLYILKTLGYTVTPPAQ